MKSYLTNEQKAESWDRLQEFLIEACKPSAPGEHKIQVTVEGKLATKQEVLDAINGKQPVAKEPAHTSCRGCEDSMNGYFNPFSSVCDDCFKLCSLPFIRKNYTPAPAPAPKVTAKEWSCSSCRHEAMVKCDYVEYGFIDCGGKNYEPLITAPKVTDAPNIPKQERQAEAWECVWELCIGLGMTLSDYDPSECIENFVRALAQRAGEERYSINEIQQWIDVEVERNSKNIKHGIDWVCHPRSAFTYLINLLDDKSEGINAFTKKRNEM